MLKATQLPEKMDIERGLTHAKSTLVGIFTGTDVNRFEELAESLLSSTGGLHISAVGPTAHVAKKVSQTLVSFNFKSAFLQPLDALHGDIGNVKCGDTVFLVSAGDSEELVQLVPVLRTKKSKVIAFVTGSAPLLSTLSDSVFYLGAPMSSYTPFSTDEQIEETLTKSIFDIHALLVLDTLAVRLMIGSEFSKTQYAENHASGKIGKHLRLHVSDVTVPLHDVPVVHEDSVGLDTLMKLASHSKGYGCILVVDKNMILKGTLSDADFRRALLRTGRKSVTMKNRELMNFSKHSPRVCFPDELAIHALNRMSEIPAVDYLPVIDRAGKIAGLVTTMSLQDAGM